jgi:murein L,D-transpeptidase YafK
MPAGRFAILSGLVLALGSVLPGAGAAAQAPEIGRPEIDRVVIAKAARSLTLYAADGTAVRIYHGIQLGWQPAGAKHFAGDGRTPEGHYRIDRGLENSAYHLALHISYPSAGDVAFAHARGRDPGGAIFIHGQPNGMAQRAAGDWTAGCIALGNAEIEEIWSLVGDDTPVDIEP